MTNPPPTAFAPVPPFLAASAVVYIPMEAVMASFRSVGECKVTLGNQTIPCVGPIIIHPGSLDNATFIGMAADAPCCCCEADITNIRLIHSAPGLPDVACPLDGIERMGDACVAELEAMKERWEGGR